MPINAKLGCLKTAERMADNPIYGSGTVRWREEYNCTLVKFERPADGVHRVDIACPVCAQPLSFEVASANRVQMKFLVTALVIAAVLAGIGWWVFTTYGAHRIGRPAALGLLAVGSIGGAITLLLGLVNPSVFDIAGEAISITQDCGRTVEQAPGIAVQSHKLLQVWIKPEEVREAATSGEIR
jgi:hypothetical protein